MSLLGRLEDLSLTDIVQIVFLSRRTGILEIIDDRGRHTVLFRQGVIVNAASPEFPDLLTFILSQSYISEDNAKTLEKMEEGGIPYGTAALELNLMSAADLGMAIKQRITAVVAPLLHSKEGEFNFILSETMTPLDMEYEPDVVFKEGGLSPQKILGSGDGEKLKPLKGLEDSLKAGKALLRGATAPVDSAPAPSLGLPLGNLPAPAAPPQAAPAPADDNVLPFPAREDEPFGAVETPTSAEPFAELEPFGESDPFGSAAEPLPFPSADEPFPAPAPAPSEAEPFGDAPAAATQPAAVASAPAALPPPPDSVIAPPSPGQFKVAGGLIAVESPDAAYRNVVLFERNPLVRVAARRAFGKRGVKIFQYGSLDDVRSAMTDLIRSNSFFVSFLELTPDEASVKVMHQLKRKNPRLPIVVIDAETDLRRRHDLLRSGADLYVTKPSPARLQPGLAEEELAMFADELVLFAERSFAQWEQMTGGGVEAGRKFYEQGEKENIDRSFGVLKQLINELSNPNDISQVSETILRMSGEYLDRGALFMVSRGEFIGLGGFGATSPGASLGDQARSLRIAASEPSILGEVVTSGEAHRGKIRRTPANVQLIETFGGLLPTEVVALPIMHANRTIGILYGDNAENRAPIDNMTGLEIFLSQAGYAFGNAVFALEKGSGAQDGL